MNFSTRGHTAMVAYADQTPTPTICEAVDSFDDADFGYWDHSWGNSVHEVPCTSPAVGIVDQEPFDQYVAPSIAVCAYHAKQVSSC